MIKNKFNKKLKILSVSIILIFIIILGWIIYIKYYYINLKEFNYNFSASSLESPNGKFKISMHITSNYDEKTLNNSIGFQPIKDKTYFVYGQLFKDPVILENGIKIWHDKNSKIIYFKKDTYLTNINWIDDENALINGESININYDTYDYRRY